MTKSTKQGECWAVGRCLLWSVAALMAAFVRSRLMSAQSRRLLVRTCLGAMLVALLALLAYAQQTVITRTWDGGGADNNWSTPSNWSSDTVPGGTGQAALFTNDLVGQTKLAPNLSADVTLGQLQYSATAPSYTITASGAAILNINPAASYGGVGLTVASGAANQTINPLVFFRSTQSWDIGGTTILTATGTIEDDSVIDYGLTKNGTGTLVFPGDVRYDGPTTVNAGSLVLSFSNTSMLSALTVNGGVLRATTSANALGSNATRNTIALAGGALELANNTGLTFGSTSRITTVSGNTTVRSDRLTAGAGVIHTLGPLRIGAQTLSVAPGANDTSGTAGIAFGATTLLGNATFNVVNSGSTGAQLRLGAIGQSGGTRSFTKTGNGDLFLNGAASYTGSTTLSQGTITLGVANALGSGGFTFAGGTLNANNTTDSTIGALALTADSTLNLSPGGAAATLTFAGVSGTANGILTITGWSGVAGGSGTNDKIVFSGGAAPNANFLQHIRFDMGGGNTYFGSLSANGELIPSALSTGAVVPNVVSLTQAAATTAITNAALLVGNVTTAASATVAAGSVISQNPAAGVIAPVGSSVALVVSSGPGLVLVPNIVGEAQAQASITLAGVGLVASVTTQPSLTIPLGNVISQNPAAGASVMSGSSVNLIVSLGNVAPAVVLTAPVNHVAGLGASVMLMASITDTDATTVTFYGRKTVPTTPGPDFVIGTIPDTQFYSQNSGGNLAAFFTDQTQWYADSRESLDTAFISHLGDMVQNGDNGSNNSEWNVADNAMRIIEDPVRTGLPHGIPWGGAPGNHDQTTVGQVNAPNAKWNQFFGADRWAGRPYFGGSFSPTNNSNNYELFEASGLEFLIIHLDYTTAAAVNQAVIDWADALMKAHPQRRAIVASHWILNLPPTSPIGAPAPFGGPGQRFFDEFKDNPNFFLMLSGHEHGEGRRTDVVDGRNIYSVLQDYQSRANGGNGWLRYFVFSPANNSITAKTYSPSLDQFESDTDATSSPRNQASEFVLPYDMQSAVAPWTTLGTVNVAAGGGSAQFNWTGLEESSTYEWYAAASDGSATTNSTARTFLTSSSVAPTVTFTIPVNNAIFTAPVNVTLAATADDADGFVTKVEFFDGLTKLAEIASPPYSYTWTNAPVGGHVLTATATEYSGATTSTSVAITVNPPPNVPPTVTLTAPANNAIFTAPVNVTLAATAGDTGGFVTKVEFFDGATKLAEITTPPYSYTWTNTPVGGHVLIAVATDNAAATATSTPVAITVSAPQPVATPTFSPAAGTYAAAQNVTIATLTSGAAIRYTTDGTAPTATTGNLYSAPVAVAATITLRAIAYRSGQPDSAVAVVTYTITPPAPACMLTANPSSIVAGNSSSLSWTTTNAASLSIDQGIGAGTPVAAGSRSVSPATTTAYTATVTGPGGANTCGATLTVNQAPPPPAVDAAYSLDAGSGTAAADLSGNGNNGTLLNGVAWTTAGKYGNALSFDGSDDFVSIPDAATLDLGSNGTIEAWVRLNAINRWNGIFAKGNANSDPAMNYALEVNNNNRFVCTLGSGSVARMLTATTTVTTGTFYHVACVWTGSQLQLYINGTLNTSVTQNLTPAANSSPLYIGQYGGNVDRISGVIDEVRIYNRALSQAEISADMNTAIAPSGPAPAVSGINPASGTQGTAMSAVITGSNFLSGATCSFGSSVTVNSCSFNSAAQLTANLTISAGAAVGSRTVTVSNPDGQSGSLASGFTVNAAPPPPAPTLNNVSPIAGQQTQTLSVTLAGVNFLSGAACSFGAGITVNSCTVNSAMQIAAGVTIAGGAATGLRDVTVTNPDGQAATLASAFMVQAAPPPPAVNAAYSLNAGSGTAAADLSGNGNNGTLLNGVAWTTAGKYGNALSFDGSDDFVSIPDAATLDLGNNGTIEAWVRLNAINRWNGIFAKGNANSDPAMNYALEVNSSNRFVCTLGSGSAARILTATTTVTTGTFYHVACVWTGTQLQLYINGTLNTSVTQNITPAANSSPLYIGQYGGNVDRISGVIDEVRIYGRPLSQSEVQADMNAALAP